MMVRHIHVPDPGSWDIHVPKQVIVMPLRFKVHENAFPHFITTATVHWIPVFVRDDYFRVLADSLTYCAEHKGLAIHGYVLMPHHFHAICSQKEGKIVEVVRDLKGFTSRRLAPMLESDGKRSWIQAMRNAGATRAEIKIWQDHFHPEQVYSQEFFEQKLRYMHDNPVRAGFVVDPCAWKYSSAGLYYLNEASQIPITPIEW